MGTDRHPNVQYVLFPPVTDAFLVLTVSSSQSPTPAAILICAGREILILSLGRQACGYFSLFAVSSDFSGTFARTIILLEMRVSGSLAYAYGGLRAP